LEGQAKQRVRAEPHYIIIGLMKTPRRKHGQVKTLLNYWSLGKTITGAFQLDTKILFFKIIRKRNQVYLVTIMHLRMFVNRSRTTESLM